MKTVRVKMLKRADQQTAEAIKTKAGMLNLNLRLGASAQTGTPDTLAAKVTKPGVERWSVKTGTDKDIGKVDVSAGVVQATVEEFRIATRPTGMPDPTKQYKAFNQKRAAPVETTVWQIECAIMAVKLEADGDYHLVLRGKSGDEMVGEIPTPDPPFVKASSPFVADIKTARAAVDKKIVTKLSTKLFAPMGKYLVPAESFVTPPPSTTTMKAALDARSAALSAGEDAGRLTFKAAIDPVPVRVTGVGFFDHVHGQTGVAPNGIELHPILSVEFL